MNAPRDMRVFAQLPKLSELKLYAIGKRYYSNEDLKVLLGLENLTKLHLVGEFKHEDYFSIICQMRNLRMLSIDGHWSILTDGHIHIR